MNATSDYEIQRRAALLEKAAQLAGTWDIHDPEPARDPRGRPVKAVLCIETGETFKSPDEAELATGIARQRIYSAIHRGNATNRLHWRYATPDEAKAVTQ